MDNFPEQILYKTVGKYGHEYREWKVPVKCEKPVGNLEIIQEGAEYHHQGGFFVASIYKEDLVGKTRAKVGYFNFHDNASDGKGYPIYPPYGMSRVDAMPSDEWYKISLKRGSNEF